MKVLVAGSVHFDILGLPTEENGHKDRRGKVSFEVGGTAFNVAHAFRELGCQPRLLTAWGAAEISELLSKYIAKAGIEIMADVNPDLDVGAFLAVLTPDGDLQAAISSMPVERHVFAPDRIAEALQGVDCLVLEANLSAETILQLARQAHSADVPVFALGVSEDKVDRLLPSLHFASGAFMNQAECARLIARSGLKDASETAELFGCSIVVTHAEKGAVVHLANGEHTYIPPQEIGLINNHLGLGDALSAGIIVGVVRDERDFIDAARRADALIGKVSIARSCNGHSENALTQLIGNMAQESKRDSLTGLYLREAFERECARYVGGRNAVLLIDCDHFKRVNDQYGHAEGDRVLRQVSEIIKDVTRAGDIACRWGGDEFVVFLPRAGGGDSPAPVVAERMRAATEKAELRGVTLSIGLAVVSADEPLSSAVERADAAMYKAKRNGKNSVSCA